ncbi:MAG: DUF2312 domain-containing protein [Alphaproteobacteria bacterium]|nr:DUF2312 domain-containing protein [Alphaproteobacteria bacterium]
MPTTDDGILSTGQKPDTAAKLTSYVERLERLMDEIDQLKDGLKDLKAEIKAEGFNVKAIDRVVAIRRSKGAADKEAEFINDVLLYAHATGTRLDVELIDDGEAD